MVYRLGACLFRVLVMLVSLAALFGCATSMNANLAPDEIVAKRAQGWADALLNKDLQGAYEYTSPNYRSYASVGRYNARVAGTVVWDKAEVYKVQCDSELCDVWIMVEYTSQRTGVEVRRPREYQWVQVKGQWWLHVAH